MVGQNPPLPRSYPVFRFATALATLLFFLTYGLNFFAPQFTAQQAYGIGGGGGSEVETFSVQAPVMEAPAATEAPVEEPSVALAPAPTMAAEATPAEDATRIMETPAAKNGEDAGNTLAQEQPQVPQEPQAIPPLVSSTWQSVLLGIAFLGALLMMLMRQMTIRRWK
jgi:hypothetical protein